MSTRTKSTAAPKQAAPKPAARKPAAPKPAAPKTPQARQAVATAAPKPATPPSAAAQPSTPTPTPTPTVTERARRGDLLDAVAERSPMRRADLKVVMELVLEEMGKLIDDGDELVLPPLGKLSVKKRVPRAGGGDMLTVKLKRLAPEGPGPGTKD
jgi:nucleoid DNA-binding protein